MAKGSMNTVKDGLAITQKAVDNILAGAEQATDVAADALQGANQALGKAVDDVSGCMCRPVDGAGPLALLLVHGLGLLAPGLRPG